MSMAMITMVIAAAAATAIREIFSHIHYSGIAISFFLIYPFRFSFNFKLFDFLFFFALLVGVMEYEHIRVFPFLLVFDNCFNLRKKKKLRMKV